MSRLVIITGFVLCGLAILWLVLDAKRRPEVIAPFGTLLDRVMTSRASRITILLFWWWLGWHFLVVAPQV